MRRVISKMNQGTVLAAAFFVSSLGLAAGGGSEAGNGGNTVVCRDSAGKVLTVELLDFYEARVMRGINRDLGDSTLGAAEKIELALKRLDPLSPLRANDYRKQALEFDSNALYLPGIQLVPVPDSFHVAFPDGCAVEQAAVRKTPVFPEDRLYTINKDLWDRMDGDSRAGLVLHEIIYRELAADVSVGARYFNSYLTSRKLEAMTRGDFIKLIREVGFSQTDIDGREYHVNGNLSLYPDGAVRAGELVEFATFQVQGKELLLSDYITLYPNGLLRSGNVLRVPSFIVGGKTYAAGGEISFFENGDVQSMEVFSSPMFDGPGYHIDCSLGAVPGHTPLIDFDKSGKMLQTFWCDGRFQVQGQIVRASTDQQISYDLFDDGKLGSIIVAADTTLLIQGKSVIVPAGQTIELYESGRIAAVYLNARTQFHVADRDLLFEHESYYVALYDMDGDRIKYGHVVGAYDLPADNGASVHVESQDVAFDEDGRVKTR